MELCDCESSVKLEKGMTMKGEEINMRSVLCSQHIVFVNQIRVVFSSFFHISDGSTTLNMFQIAYMDKPQHPHKS